MNMMKKLACALALCVALPCGASAAELAVLDVAKVYTESKAAKAADKHLADVRAVLQKGMADLEKSLENRKLTKQERENELAAGLRVLERQMQIEMQAARAVVHEMMVDAVKNWRKKKSAAVIAKQQLIDFNPKLDITDTVIKSMNAKQPKFGDMPVVKINDPQPDKKDEKKDAKPAKK